MRKNILYILICLFIVFSLSLLFFKLQTHDIFFTSSEWATIYSHVGFSLTLLGVIIAIWLYNYITYEDVQKSINEDHYLSIKGLEELKKNLNKFVDKLNVEKNFSKVDFSPQIHAIKHYFEFINGNPKSTLAPYKKNFSTLVSHINRSAIGKKDNNAIDIHTRRKLAGEASNCIRTIEIIQEIHKKQARM